MRSRPSGIHAKPWYYSKTLHWVISSWLGTIALSLIDIVENGGVINAKIVAYFFLETVMLYQTAVSRMFEVDVLTSPNQLPGYSQNEAEQIIQATCVPKRE